MNINGSIEKHSFKISIGVAVSVIIFLIAMTVQFTTWQIEMQAEHTAIVERLDNQLEGFKANFNKINILDDRQDNTDVNMAQISTKLSNIEALLVDIKIELKDKE